MADNFLQANQPWTLGTIVRRAYQVVREQGMGALLFKILGETIYRRVIVITRSLDEPVADATPRLPVEIHLLNEAQVEAYVRFRPDTTRLEVMRRLRAGQSCYVAWWQGEIVYASWSVIRTAWIDYLAREIELAPDTVYVYQAFAAPQVRGLNLVGAVTAMRVRALRARGYRILLAVVMPENVRARKSFAKLGYCVRGTLGYVRLAWWRHDFYRPARAPDVAASAYWDEIAMQFRARRGYLDPFLSEQKKRAHVELIQRWGGVPSEGRVLKTDLFEEAHGDDSFLTDLAAGENCVIGMDVSRAVVERARARDAAHRAQYVVADARRLPFAADTFALIVSPSSLDHFTDAVDLPGGLRELARVLRRAGRLMVTLDNRENVTDGLFRLANRWHWLPYWVGHSYTIHELRAQLQNMGLRVADTTAILHNPRLLAVGLVACVNGLRWRPLIALVHRALNAAQRFERTRWRYRTGSFIAALGVKDDGDFD